MYRHIRFYAVEVFCCRSFKLCPNCSVERAMAGCRVTSFSINDLIKGSKEMSGYLWMCFVRFVKLGGEPTKLIRTISGKLTKVNNVKRHFF